MPERYLGRTLGRFRVEAIVGSGGFAWVYKGYDPELDIPVALKVLKPQFAGDEAFESRFRREASIAAKLRHPNIIRILAVGRDEESGAVYFVMDFLPHGMVDRIRVMGPLPESLLVRIGMDVASALAFAHREQVVHRDIKPDNIMFDEHGNSIVADFGIARAVVNYTKETGTNMVVGTPQYFSPEQARGLPLDGRADLYSLGITLFKGATNTLPFEGDDWYEIARQHVEDTPPRPRSINPNISEELERIILKLLEKDPDDRYPNAEAVYEALAPLAGGAATASQAVTIEVPAYADRTSTTAEMLGAERRPSRRALIVGAGTVLIAGTALAVALTRDRAPALGGAAADSAARATATRPDSARRADTARRAGEIVTPVDSAMILARHATLAVRSPRDARVTLNGAAVPRGGGSWQTDTLPPGSYTLVATVATLDGCPTARDEQRVALGDSGTRTVTLRPRACGTLQIIPRTDGAAYTIRSRADGSEQSAIAVKGTPRSFVLPAGTYDVRATKDGCRAFSADTLRVQPGQTLPLPFRLDCS